MPLHSPSTPKPDQPSAVPPSGSQKKSSPGFIDWLKQYWERVTEGLEMGQLWKQFKSDAEVSFRFYRRDFDARSPHGERTKNILHTIQEFTWALLEKLSPARRVLVLLGVLILFFGGMGFSYKDKEGAVHGISIDFHFYAGLILLVVLMLLGVLILFFGGMGFSYKDKEGAVHGISIDFHFYAGLILLVVLMLEVAD